MGKKIAKTVCVLVAVAGRQKVIFALFAPLQGGVVCGRFFVAYEAMNLRAKICTKANKN